MNKFNMTWQLIRTKAKLIKDVNKKVNYVLDFVKEDNYFSNYDRVKNWLRTTSYAYKDRSVFNNALTLLETLNYIEGDSDDDLNNFDQSEIEMVLKDLNKRKYNFQFKGAPKDHIVFVEKLTEVINER